MFKHRTLVGNWAEERDREEELIGEYMAQKAKGEATVANRSGWMARNMAKVKLTYTEDMILRYWATVLIQNFKTHKFLAVSVDETPGERCNEFDVSAVASHTPVARNTFIVLPEKDGEEEGAGRPVCFGDRVRIAANPELFPSEIPHLFIESHVAALSSSSTRVPGYQPACLRQLAEDVPLSNVVWIVEHQDPKLRLEVEGEPIRNTDVVLLRQAMYNRCLISLDSLVRTDYGQEGEVGALTVYDMHRVESEANRWSFVLALRPQ